MGFLDSLSEIGGEKLGEGRVVVGVDSGPLKRGLGDIGKTVEGAATNWGAAFKVAKIGLAGLATAFIGFAIEGTKKADELDAAVGRIAAQVGLTTGETAKLRVGLLDMSTRTKQGVDELAKSIESVAKAGYNVDDSLRIQEASARAATVTNADLGAVTNTVVTAMKAWGVEGKNVGGVVDTLITTVGRSRIDWDALSRILATAAPIAKDAGVSFGDLNAAIIAIGRSGLPARRAAAGVIALIRSMSSPTAQKEMKLLGITVNATTIAHDGLLKTLEKIEKASGKNVSVLVKNKKGQIDYQKSVDATTKANRGQLQALQAMFGGAAGLVTADILLANGAKDYTEAQNALNHSLGATNAEFDKVKEADLSVQLALIRNEITKFAIELGTNLLPYAAKFLQWAAVAIPAALKGIGDLWTNTLAGPIGNMVKSFVGFADALFSALFNWNTGSAQNARGGMTSFFGGLSSIVVSLAQDLGGVFDVLKFILNLPFAGVAVKALAFVAILRGAVSLSKALGGALTSKFLSGLNFVTGGVFKLTGSASSINSGPLGQAARATTEAATKTGEAATKTGEAAARTTEAAAKTSEAATEASTKLSEAAIRLTEAGAVIAEKSSIGGAAEAIGGAEGFNAAEAIRQNTYNESTIEANQSTVKVNERTLAADKASLKASDSIVATTEQQQVGIQQQKVANEATVTSAEAMKSAAGTIAENQRLQTSAVVEGQDAQVLAVKEGQAAQAAANALPLRPPGGWPAALSKDAAALKGGGGGIGNAIGGALGAVGGVIGNVVGKVVVPLLITQLATDIVKAPLGDFISTSLHHERVGELMKKDFFGGLVALWQTTFDTNGNDSFVGRADTMKIGNATFKTMTLAKLGVDNATFDELQAPEGTIENARGKKSLATFLNKGLQGASGAKGDILGYYNSIKAQLADEIQTQADAIVKTYTSYQLVTTPGDSTGTLTPVFSPAGQAALQALLTKGISTQISGLNQVAHDAYVAALGPALQAQGFTAADISRIPTADLDALDQLAQADTQGTFDYVRRWIVERAVLGAKAATQDQQRALVGDSAKHAKSIAQVLGPNWQTLISQVAVGAPKGTAEKSTAKKLAGLFGAQWQTITKDVWLTLREDATRSRTGDIVPGTFKGQMKLLGDEQKTALQAINDYYKNFPQQARVALDQVVQQSQKLSPTIRKGLNALFKTTGDDWITGLRNGPDALLAQAKSSNTKVAGAAKAEIAQLTTYFGTSWAADLQSFGTQMWAREGGDAAAALKTALVGAITKDIAKLTAADFAPTGKTTVSGKTETTDKAAATKFLTSKKGLDDLAQAASTDAATAKDGFTKLGNGLKASIPDESSRNRFIGMIVALQKLATTPDVAKAAEAIDSVSGTLPDKLDAVTIAMYGLASSADYFLGRIHHGSSTDTTHPPPNKKGRNTPAAHGAEFSVNSATDMQFGGVRVTAGEAGSEEVAIVSKPKTVSWAELAGIRSAHVSVPGGMTRGGGGEGGRSQTLYVDHMHIQSKPDERAILETLEFMAPGGIA